MRCLADFHGNNDDDDEDHDNAHGDVGPYPFAPGPPLIPRRRHLFVESVTHCVVAVSGTNIDVLGRWRAGGGGLVPAPGL